MEKQLKLFLQNPAKWIRKHRKRFVKAFPLPGFTLFVMDREEWYKWQCEQLGKNTNVPAVKGLGDSGTNGKVTYEIENIDHEFDVELKRTQLLQFLRERKRYINNSLMGKGLYVWTSSVNFDNHFTQKEMQFFIKQGWLILSEEYTRYYIKISLID